MRSKLVDIEAEVLGDGFVLGSTESEGNFAEDGFPDFKWSAKVSEIEMDLTSISSLCESMMGGEESGEDDSMGGGMSCEALLGGAAGVCCSPLAKISPGGCGPSRSRSNGRTQVILKDFDKNDYYST